MQTNIDLEQPRGRAGFLFIEILMDENMIKLPEHTDPETGHVRKRWYDCVSEPSEDVSARLSNGTSAFARRVWINQLDAKLKGSTFGEKTDGRYKRELARNLSCNNWLCIDPDAIESDLAPYVALQPKSWNRDRYTPVYNDGPLWTYGYVLNLLEMLCISPLFLLSAIN